MCEINSQMDALYVHEGSSNLSKKLNKLIKKLKNLLPSSVF